MTQEEVMETLMKTYELIDCENYEETCGLQRLNCEDCKELKSLLQQLAKQLEYLE